MATPTPTPAPPDAAAAALEGSPARAATFRSSASGSTRTLSGLRSRLSHKLNRGHRHTESAPAGWAPTRDDAEAFDAADEPAQGGAADIHDSAAHAPSSLRPAHARNFSSASAASVGRDAAVPPPPLVARAAEAASQLVGGSSTPRSHPIAAQTQLILGALVATALAAQLLGRLLHLTAGLAAIAVGAHVLLKKLDIAARDVTWEQAAAGRASEGQGRAESAEWINHVLGVVWPLISTDYFVPFVDLLEDALMQQVPGIVHGCRVDGLDQGTIPLRIVGFTRLPSHEEAFLHGADAKHNVSEAEETLSDVGDFVNLEVSFAYRAPRARRKMASSNKAEGLGSEAAGLDDDDEDRGAAEQIHLLIYMAIGLQKLAAVEVPVWIEMLGIEGKMRLRLQLTPAAPFVKHVAFCFVGAPRIEISAKPLGKRMVIDAMNLPLISSYVLRSIEAVIKDFIAPQSYSIDAGALLGAADGPQNVYSLGVLVVVLHRASDLPAADVGGTSDPFVKISFARAGKPLYMSRVLVKTCNPVWGETAFLLVGPDEVRDHERMRLGVFDADRFSSDDELGHVDVSIARLIRRSLHKESEPGAPSLIEDRDDALVPPRRGATTSGRLRYSVAFCRLAQPTSGGRSAHRQDLLRQAARNAPASAGAESEKRSLSLPDSASYAPDEKQEKRVPEHLLTAFDRFVVRMGFPLDPAVMHARAERAERVARLKALIEGEAEATASPPQREWPAGILAFHIHSIDGLEVPTTQRNFNNSKRLEKKPRYTTSDEAAGNKATPKFPSSYVQVFLNDEAIFRTRTKALDPRPFINAGSERWVSDWQTARVDFVVRDQRMRESDPILGLVGLRLADVLKESSRSTGYYTLTGGLGFGKIRLSLVWRSVELRVPRPLSGWNLGVLEISAARVSGLQLADVDDGRAAQLYFETVGGTAETETKDPHAEGTAGATIGYDYPLQQSLRVAVRQRYPSFLYIHLRSDSRVPGRRHRHAHGAIPLNRIADGEGVFKRVMLFASSEWQEIEQQALGSYPPQSSATSRGERAVLDEICAAADATAEQPASSGLRHIGFVDLTFVFHAGIAQEHRSLVAGDNELRYAFETFLAGIDGGERAKPAKLSPSLRRSLSLAHVDAPDDAHDHRYSSEASSSGNALRVDTGVAESNSKHRAAAAVNPDLMSPEELEEQEGEDSDREWEEGNNEINDDDDDTTPEGRRARQRALHRQHKGAAQIKGYRSLQWVAQNAQDSLGRMKRMAGQQSKSVGKMESEGVSHF